MSTDEQSSKDIVARLRSYAPQKHFPHVRLMQEAASTIETVYDSHRWLFAEKKRLEAILERINMAACYASEENTDARAETLLLIGQLARQEALP